ncbi:MAG: hypothetical protein R3B70_00620 [Polyangiaceae bacterium]
MALPAEAGAGGGGSRGALAREARHLAELRARVSERPEEVLAGAAVGDRAFADGALAEEREALAIDALVRLGRTDEARERARAFVARYPKSTQVTRMRAILAGEAAGARAGEHP